jgi:hypothetical protein
MAEEERPSGPSENNVISFPTIDVRAARQSQPVQEVIKDLYESRETADTILVAVIRKDGGVEFGCSQMPIARAIWLATYLRLRVEKEMEV